MFIDGISLNILQSLFLSDLWGGALIQSVISLNCHQNLLHPHFAETEKHLQVKRMLQYMVNTEERMELSAFKFLKQQKYYSSISTFFKEFYKEIQPKALKM